MNEKTIVQFVGFITGIEFDKFVVRWEYYVQQLKDNKMKATLQKQRSTKNRYKYISQHSGNHQDFNFAFMKKRQSEHFPEHEAKVVHMGGYFPLQKESSRLDRQELVNIMVFVKELDADVDAYRQLQHYRKLNIYQAYFENCAYGYIMEFFVKDADAAKFILQLDGRMATAHSADEVGLYEEYSLLHA
ncbi:MAG: hypothetical protein ACHQET_11415 [Chitinophagales bacterium]